MLKLAYRHAALADLDAIYNIIEADNPRRALSYVQDIRERCGLLCDHPMKGRARDDLRSGIRVLAMFGRVVVAYRITPSAILVTRVFYGGRDFEAILSGHDDDGDGKPE